MGKQEIYFSYTNKQAVTRAVEWLPEGEPKAVLHICCDGNEQIQCTEELAGYFVLQGFVVIVCNHYEQGEMHHCLQVIKHKYADVPHVLLGCSHSAAAVHSFISKYPEAVEGAVLADEKQSTVVATKNLPVLQISGIAGNRQEVFRNIYRWAEERLDEMLYQAATKHYS